MRAALRLETRPPRLWTEFEVYFLVLVALGIYFSRLTTLTIRGEESRRARVAQEMLDSGDWIVERQQGEIFADRPPLGEWAIAAATLLNGGQMTTATIRLPAVTATLLTGLLLYFYARSFMTRAGAFGTGVAYLTFGQVLQIGRLAESEAIFILLLGAAMLVWHAGYVGRWRPWLMWSAGYALAAFSGLTKGPQGPVYFCAAIGLYLLVRRDWRCLLSGSHLLGLCVFAAIFLVWLVPYYLRTNYQAARDSLLGVSLVRFGGTTPLWQHMASYPLQILACLLPWSPLFVRYFDRSFWAGLGNARPHVIFGFTAIAATFPSVWFASEALNRHYMGLYPCFALLAGVVIDRCLASDVGSLLRRRWNWYLGGMSVVMLAIGVVVCGAGFIPGEIAGRVAQAVPFVVLFAIGVLAAVGVSWWSIRSLHSRGGELGLLAVAAFLGLSYTGIMINIQANISEDSAAAVAKVKGNLPPGTQLVSLGRLDHVFTFHYRDAIPVVPWPQTANALPDDAEYFCFSPEGSPAGELPFAWEKIAVVSCDRNHLPEPQRTVVIGRRLDTATARTQQLAEPTKRFE